MPRQRIDGHRIGACLAALALLAAAGCQSLPSTDFIEAITQRSAPAPHIMRLPPADTSALATANLPAGDARPDEVAAVAYFEQDDDAMTVEPVEAQPLPHSADEDGMTLDQLEQMALAANPAVAAAQARVQALYGKWVQVGLFPNPKVGYTSDDIGEDGSDGKHGGFVGQQIVTGGKLRLNRAVAAEEMAKAEQQLAAVQQRVITDVRIGYYDVLIAQRKLDLANELVRISQQAAEASRALVEAQEISVVGLLQTEVEGENALIFARRATNESEAAWRRLTSVSGNPHLRPQKLHGDLDQTATALTWNEQLDRLVTQSPEIAAAVTEVERARWALNRAYVEAKPDIDFQVAVQYDDISGDTVTGVQVELPLPLWNKNQGGIQQAASDVIAAEHDIQRVELSLRRRLADVFQSYSDASYQVARYTENILPKARRTVDLVSGGFQAGEVGYLDMLAAQRTYSQTNLAYIESLRALWRARLRIDGLLLDGSLEVGQ